MVTSHVVTGKPKFFLFWCNQVKLKTSTQCFPVHNEEQTCTNKENIGFSIIIYCQFKIQWHVWMSTFSLLRSPVFQAGVGGRALSHLCALACFFSVSVTGGDWPNLSNLCAFFCLWKSNNNRAVQYYRQSVWYLIFDLFDILAWQRSEGWSHCSQQDTLYLTQSFWPLGQRKEKNPGWLPRASNFFSILGK